MDSALWENVADRAAGHALPQWQVSCYPRGPMFGLAKLAPHNDRANDLVPYWTATDIS